MASATREKTLHRLFLISVWIKGGAGLLETLAGIPFFFVTPRVIEDFVVLLTAPELSEDPNRLDCHYHPPCCSALFCGYRAICRRLSYHSRPDQDFFSRRSLAGKIVAYPTSLWFLVAFIVYQCDRYAYTHSIWLVLLTVLDVIVAFLIWHEYQSRKQLYAR